MRHIGRGVEEAVDAVAAVALHHREAIRIRDLLDNVANLAELYSGSN